MTTLKRKITMVTMKKRWFFKVKLFIAMATSLTCVYATIRCVKYPIGHSSLLPRSYVKLIDCKAISRGDQYATMDALQVSRQQHEQTGLKEEDYIRMAENCNHFLESRNYWIEGVSDEESNFPLAFGILAYTNFEYMERLLRAIYRPHNIYVIHVDKKASLTYRRAALAVATCLPNVTVLPDSSSVWVTWGMFSVLEASMAVMREAWNQKSWKYFLLLTGQEFPLKTNQELVRLLQDLKGENSMPSSYEEAQKFKERYMLGWFGWIPYKFKSPPPHDIKVAKGETHIVAARPFADYLLHHQLALDFFEWCRNVFAPEEFFFTSLDKHIMAGKQNQSVEKPVQPRYKIWIRSNNDACGGQVVRGICVFGIRDLPGLVNSPALFANKFMMHIQPLAYDCLEEIFLDRIWKKSPLNKHIS